MANKEVKILTHDEASRKNIPTAEFQSVLSDDKKGPIRLAYERRNRDLDPQLLWSGKDEENENTLGVQAQPLYIQEKVHPKALIDDLLRASRQRTQKGEDITPDLFSDFNGISEEVDKTEFYQHDQNWSNRMILGDSLQVMAGLAEREGLRGNVQCIYIDPPYGIKFNSNFQWSTISPDVKDGNVKHITREPEQVRAFRDIWRDGIHSYLTYLRDRLTVARDLLTDSGSIFVQIGDKNVHRVRLLMDEVFGDENFIVTLKFSKTSGLGGKFLDETFDYILWFAKNRDLVKFRRLYLKRVLGQPGATQYTFGMSRKGTFAKASDGIDANEWRIFAHDNLTSQTGNDTTRFEFSLGSRQIPTPKKGGWKTNSVGIERLKMANRIVLIGNSAQYVRYFDDAPYFRLGSAWLDTGVSGFADKKMYVVQTAPLAIQRCILMATDPGDLVLDPTCGSGTTATVAERWGRRWITIDTSRVALALARARIMGARYPFYLLADSHEGQAKESEVTGKAASSKPMYGSIRQGFVYKRVPHITLKSITNNAEIDVIWDAWQTELESLRNALNTELNESWEEWEIPHEAGIGWTDSVVKLHSKYWDARIARQKEIDTNIEMSATFEYLYDEPYEDRKTVRVAGPFTVESLSPHRILGVDENDELIETQGGGGGALDNLFRR